MNVFFRFFFVLVLLGVGAPAVQAQPDAPVPFISGGVGADERATMTHEAAVQGYNLKIITAAVDGAYLAGIDVRIADHQGATVLHATMDGPWLLAKLPAGRYDVTVDDGVRKQTRKVNIVAGAKREAIFRWQRAADPVIDRGESEGAH